MKSDSPKTDPILWAILRPVATVLLGFVFAVIMFRFRMTEVRHGDTKLIDPVGRFFFVLYEPLNEQGFSPREIGLIDFVYAMTIGMFLSWGCLTLIVHRRKPRSGD